MSSRAKFVVSLFSALGLSAGGALLSTGCDSAAGSSTVPDISVDVPGDTDDLVGGDTVTDTSTTDTSTTDTAMPDVDMPQPCGANDDCPAGEVCTIRVASDGSLVQACGAPVGPGLPGAACTSNQECQSGTCHMGVCISPCVDETDCPANFACEERMVSGQAVNVCIEQPTPCAANSDCTAPEQCIVDRGATPPSATCGTPVGTGMLGDACTADANCAQNLCLGGICTLPCARPVDCQGVAGFTCAADSSGQVDFNVCEPVPPGECQYDGDPVCANNERCVAQKSPAEITFVCGMANPGGRDTGENCAADGDCALNLCLDGQCAAPCAVAGRDCPTDNDCVATDVDLGNGLTDSANLCSAPVPCAEDDECLVGEVCYVERGQTTIALTCESPNVGGQPGQVCTEDGDCRSNLCLQTRFGKVCSQPCVDASDCDATGYQCNAVDLPALDNTTTVNQSVCTPPPAPACTSQADCAGGTVCAVVENAAGSALETVCIPTPGGSAAGVACSANDQCTSQLCLDGACSAPCVNVNQCGNGQLCSSNTVTKNGLSGTFDLCKSPPQVLCSDSSACSATNRVCGGVAFGMSSIDTSCVFPNAGGKNLGESCGANSECFHNICLGVNDECTVVCNDNTDCSGGQICTGYRFQVSNGTDDLQVCARGCVDDASCASATGNPDSICTVNSNFVDNRIDQVCENQVGTGDIGAPCTDANGQQDGSVCTRGICLRTTQGTCTTSADCDQAAGFVCRSGNCTVDNCTALCDGSSDCTGSTVAGNPLTTCSQSITITPPNGGAGQTISACARN